MEKETNRDALNLHHHIMNAVEWDFLREPVVQIPTYERTIAESNVAISITKKALGFNHERFFSAWMYLNDNNLLSQEWIGCRRGGK